MRAARMRISGFSFYAREDDRIRGLFLPSSMIPRDWLHCPLDLCISLRLFDEHTISQQHPGSEKRVASHPNGCPFGSHHNSYYCFTWFNFFWFRRLYPARLSTRRRVPQKDPLLMARTFGMAMESFTFYAHRGLRFAFYDQITTRPSLGSDLLLIALQLQWIHFQTTPQNNWCYRTSYLLLLDNCPLPVIVRCVIVLFNLSSSPLNVA